MNVDCCVLPRQARRPRPAGPSNGSAFSLAAWLDRGARGSVCDVLEIPRHQVPLLCQAHASKSEMFNSRRPSFPRSSFARWITLCGSTPGIVSRKREMRESTGRRWSDTTVNGRLNTYAHRASTRGAKHIVFRRGSCLMTDARLRRIWPESISNSFACQRSEFRKRSNRRALTFGNRRQGGTP